MFTGIIEATGKLVHISSSGKNRTLEIECDFTKELKAGQSVSHNGVCLTVEQRKEKSYTVTAIEETLIRSNLGELKVGDYINLERALKVGDRLDGHFVQGHVDTKALCTKIEDHEGSKVFSFEWSSEQEGLMVDKGSICINGISLTLTEARNQTFSVALIPFTLEHTNMKSLKKGEHVNIEFDVLGKYIARLAAEQHK